MIKLLLMIEQTIFFFRVLLLFVRGQSYQRIMSIMSS